MALDTKRPKGDRKAWNGGQRPEIPADAIAICTSCGEYVTAGRPSCGCPSPSLFPIPPEDRHVE